MARRPPGRAEVPVHRRSTSRPARDRAGSRHRECPPAQCDRLAAAFSHVPRGVRKYLVGGSGRFIGLTLDPEFLKEDAKLVSETVLAAVQDAAKQAKDYHEAEMQKITGAFQMPGMF